MRLIEINEYNHVTMQLARPILDRQQRVLLAQGRTIHPKYLERIKEMDIKYLFVEDAVSFGITMEEMLDMPVWIDSIEIVKKVFIDVKKSSDPMIRELQRLTIRLVNEVNNRKVLVLIPTTSMPDELRMYAHALNVALLSLQIGKKLGYNQLNLKDLAMGALLHDIGKVITDIEEEHPLKGFEYLRKIREISLLSAHVAFQHHERIDGKGYPRGLSEKQIHDFAQICALSNDYDQHISIEGIPPYIAMEMIMAKSGTYYREDIVQTFVQQIPSYTPGTKVMVNHNQEAIVTKIKNNIQRPYIRFLATNQEVSLADHLTLLITGIIKEEA
jgi:putative nucleotidyltransferase with HDIG domain